MRLPRAKSSPAGDSHPSMAGREVCRKDLFQFFGCSAWLSIAACAQASSLSLVSPVTPIAPRIVPSAPHTITPPAAGTMPPSLIVWSEATKCGRSTAISPIVRLETPSASAPQPFPPASLTRMFEAPSCRWQAIRWPPGSCTVTVSGLRPSSAPLAKAASIRALAWARSRRCMMCSPTGRSSAGFQIPPDQVSREMPPDRSAQRAERKKQHEESNGLTARKRASSARGARSAPLHLGRQAHQDGVDVAAGLEPEQGASVIDEVEFDIAATPFELLLLLRRRPIHSHPLADDPGEHVEERFADVLREYEVAFPLRLVGALHVVVEDPADAARNVAVRDEEVLVGPLAEALVVGGVVRHAGGAEAGVESFGIFGVGDRRVEVGAAAEPCLAGGQETRVHVNRGHVRVCHVRDQADAGCGEAGIVLGTVHSARELGRESTLDSRDVDADLHVYLALTQVARV